MTDIFDDLPDPALIAGVLAFLEGSSVTCGNCGRILFKEDFEPEVIEKLNAKDGLECPFCKQPLEMNGS